LRAKLPPPMSRLGRLAFLNFAGSADAKSQISSKT
jgi:hypothetical protein